MKYYIFNTEKDAKDYDTQVTQARMLHNGDNHANPIKHPSLNKWAVLFNFRVIIEGKSTEELTQDWFQL